MSSLTATSAGIVGAVALSNFFGNIVFSILLVFAVRELGLSAGTIGVVLAVGNLGTLVAALTARRISDRLGVGRTIVLAAFLFGPGHAPDRADAEGSRDSADHARACCSSASAASSSTSP